MSDINIEILQKCNKKLQEVRSFYSVIGQKIANAEKTCLIPIVVSLFLLFIPFVAAADVSDHLLFDFEKNGLSVDWSAKGHIQAARKPMPPIERVTGLRPAGKGITIKTGGKGGIYAKRGRVPRDWRGFENLSFWVYRSADETAKFPRSILEIQLYEADGRSRFWRRIDVSHRGWRQFTVPLRWFRWGSGRIPRWDRIDRFGFWFRDGAELSIDTVWFTKDDAKTAEATVIAPEELLKVAFPGGGETSRIVRGEGFVVITDVALLDDRQLSGHLQNVSRAVFADYPFLVKPLQPPRLLVFSTRAAYQEFFARFASNFNSATIQPDSTGYTMRNIACSYWDEEFGTLRPVYTHEFVHALMAESLYLPNKSAWLHEGMATVYQLRFHPQANSKQIVQEGLSKKDFHMPLSELCNGRRIPMKRYWQAMTVIETLRSNDSYRRRLPELFDAFRKAGSSDLNPHIKPILGTDWDQLTAAWKKFCRAMTMDHNKSSQEQ